MSVFVVKIENDAESPVKLSPVSPSDVVSAKKQLKENKMTIGVADVKPVLGQIMMNHQDQSQSTEPPKKKRRVSDGSAKMRPAPAVAVARRNARERNRVKQVNNGFSMLRDHIPPEIADTYDQAGRGNAKKLSKVETLRMAVEYIRSLETLLNLDTSDDSELCSPTYHGNNNNSTFSEASLPATPPPESQQPFFYALKPHGGVMETQITIIGGQQYMRIPGTNTFQLVTHDVFENEENIHPNGEYTTIQVHPPSSSPHMIPPMMLPAPSLNFGNEINSSTSVINSTTASETPAGSISPYSGHSSLSPAPSHHADNISNNIMMESGRFTTTTIARHQSEEDRRGLRQSLPYAEQLMMSHEASHYDHIILKEEIVDDEGMFDDSSLSNEHMIDAMQWFEQQQNLSHTASP